MPLYLYVLNCQYVAPLTKTTVTFTYTFNVTGTPAFCSFSAYC
jgi:hypothetical protein